ncbi:Disease resistance protein RPS6 [Cardamine amara subsp. amara]|uniref:Disease resistance protein RPS6 n=1 Tax=Cardamine amara subsp. amara TaxID=228776 RepID=A0ABD1ALG7_CARAN
MASSSSSSTHNWVYDVFPSFRGEDVRISFLSHLHLALDSKLIKVFKDNKIPRSLSIGSELVQVIRDSKIAVVLISENYGSSSWCLNELVEIMKCKDEFGQIVIPVFYGLNPSHVRKQTGKFGKAFENTCQNKSKYQKKLWQKALTNVADIAGYYSGSWDNEASMIQEIANDVLVRLKLTTTSMDF